MCACAPLTLPCSVCMRSLDRTPPGPLPTSPKTPHRTEGVGEFTAKSSRRANLVGHEAGTGWCSTIYRCLKSPAPCAFVAAAAQSWRQAPLTKGRHQRFGNLSGKVGRKHKKKLKKLKKNQQQQTKRKERGKKHLSASCRRVFLSFSVQREIFQERSDCLWRRDLKENGA